MLCIICRNVPFVHCNLFLRNVVLKKRVHSLNESFVFGLFRSSMQKVNFLSMFFLKHSLQTWASGEWYPECWWPASLSSQCARPRGYLCTSPWPPGHYSLQYPVKGIVSRRKWLCYKNIRYFLFNLLLLSWWKNQTQSFSLLLWNYLLILKILSVACFKYPKTAILTLAYRKPHVIM
jgi:hypothetical protein